MRWWYYGRAQFNEKLARSQAEQGKLSVRNAKRRERERERESE